MPERPVEAGPKRISLSRRGPGAGPFSSVAAQLGGQCFMPDREPGCPDHAKDCHLARARPRRASVRGDWRRWLCAGQVGGLQGRPLQAYATGGAAKLPRVEADVASE